MSVVNASGLTEAQKKELNKLLSDKAASLEAEIKDLEAELTEESADGQNQAPDEVDRSSFEEDMQRRQLVLDGKKRLRNEVLAALRRFDSPTYGVCEETEEPIGYKRLKAQPWTRFSLEAQQDLEARRKNSSFGSSLTGTMGFGVGSANESTSAASEEESEE